MGFYYFMRLVLSLFQHFQHLSGYKCKITAGDIENDTVNGKTVNNDKDGYTIQCRSFGKLDPFKQNGLQMNVNLLI